MHGLINRSIQCFLRDTYGDDAWSEIASAAGLEFDNFEALMIYEDVITERVLQAASTRLDKPVPVLLEDLGTFLISNASSGALRRLLRFGGVSFVDFLHSLDDLQDRVRLAVPDLVLPALEVRDHTSASFTLTCRFHQSGYGHVFVGILRAMADDYGALVLLEHLGDGDGSEMITIEVLDIGYAEGRSFALGMSAA